MATPPPAGIAAVGESLNFEEESVQAQQPGKGHDLAGLVLDEASRPLAGLEVWLHHQGRGPPTSAERVRLSITDESGAFAFSALPPGPWRAEVRVPGQPPALHQDVGALREETSDRLLVVPRQVCVDLTVRHRDGPLVAGALVALTRTDPQSTWQVRTDAQGRVRLSYLPTGPYRLSITAVGCTRLQEDLLLTQTGPVDLERRLDPISRGTRPVNAPRP